MSYFKKAEAISKALLDLHEQTEDLIPKKDADMLLQYSDGMRKMFPVFKEAGNIGVKVSENGNEASPMAAENYALYYPKITNFKKWLLSGSPIRFGALCAVKENGSILDVFSGASMYASKNELFFLNPVDERVASKIKHTFMDRRRGTGYCCLENGARFHYFSYGENAFRLTKNSTALKLTEGYPGFSVESFSSLTVRKALYMMFYQAPRMNAAFAEIFADDFLRFVSAFTNTSSGHAMELDKNMTDEIVHFKIGGGNVLDMSLKFEDDVFYTDINLNDEHVVTVPLKGSIPNSENVRVIADGIAYIMQDKEYDMTSSSLSDYLNDFYYGFSMRDEITMKIHQRCHKMGLDIPYDGKRDDFLVNLVRAMDPNGIYANLFSVLEDYEIKLLSGRAIIPVPASKVRNYRTILSDVQRLCSED